MVSDRIFTATASPVSVLCADQTVPIEPPPSRWSSTYKLPSRDPAPTSPLTFPLPHITNRPPLGVAYRTPTCL